MRAALSAALLERWPKAVYTRVEPADEDYLFTMRSCAERIASEAATALGWIDELSHSDELKAHYESWYYAAAAVVEADDNDAERAALLARRSGEALNGRVKGPPVAAVAASRPKSITEIMARAFALGLASSSVIDLSQRRNRAR